MRIGNFVVELDMFSGTKKSFSINYELNCNSGIVVYLLSCKVCGIQYVGSTINKFQTRFNNHKSSFKAHSKISTTGKESDDIIYRHFLSRRHHGPKDVKIQIINKVHSKDDLSRW